MTPNDQELVLKALSGDKTSFSQLFQKYHKMVHAMAFQIIGPDDVLEDILQETFLRAFKQLHTLRNQNQFGTWLGSICKKVAQEYLRSQKARPFSLEKLQTQSKFDCPEGKSGLPEAQRNKIFQRVAELPEIFREVVLLKYVDNLSYQEISILLKISPATVNARLLKAKLLLKQKMKRDED